MNYADIIAVEAQRHHVSAPIIAAIVEYESNGKWWAKGLAGEIGLAQILPSTARELCPFEARLLWFAQPNISCAARVLRYHIKRCGSIAAGVSAFNGSRHCAVTSYGTNITKGIK